ncbi:hypothetical protein V6N11_038437 [Hibiscus sabdariffa]|uniref:Protein kinase domain-containing protein n=1 Tax=Hibiscus sabdariffa TaxID=183260 RepID=A0ABR2SK90_9ROSI
MTRPKQPLFWSFLHLLALALSFFPLACTARILGKRCDSSNLCGNLNISHPFRIKSRPHSCGLKTFELVCDNNNRTVLSRGHGDFYVQHISYVNHTIQLVDVNLVNQNCSLPLSSLPLRYPFKGTLDQQENGGFYAYYNYSEIYVVKCSRKMNESWSGVNYIDASPCSSSSPTNDFIYYYFVDGAPFALHPSCTVEARVPSSLHNISGASTSDIYKNLMIGVQLRWSPNFREDSRWLQWNSVANILKSLLFSVAYGLTPLRMFIGMILWIFFLIGLIHKLRRRHLSIDEEIENFLQSQKNFMPIRYSYAEVKKITEGFKNKLGQGGFGTVFKGKLRSGKLVAVKLLNESKGNGQDFINEVATIGRIHHVNVVQLVGFCVEGKKQALVYDFMTNGSLDKFLFLPENSSLSWQKMFEIALGIGRGIEYLHTGCAMQILHFDIKPHNILLDENFNPKVSDFGLAKSYSTGDSIVSLTAARGTIGYMAPELFYKSIGSVSYKADVYSFGMMLMEMVGRRKNLNAFANHSSQIYFPSWIYDQFELGENIELGDMTENENRTVRKMIIVAFWCIQTKPIHRPSMSKVLKMLESEVEPLEVPPRSFVFSVDMSSNEGD